MLPLTSWFWESWGVVSAMIRSPTVGKCPPIPSPDRSVLYLLSGLESTGKAAANLLHITEKSSRSMQTFILVRETLSPGVTLVDLSLRGDMFPLGENE